MPYSLRLHTPEEISEKHRQTYYRHREAKLAYVKRYSAKNWKEKERKRKERHGEKIKTRKHTQYLAKHGFLSKPDHCTVCSDVLPKAKIHAHHSDYSKPGEVIWCCASCHALLQRKEILVR